MPDEPVSMENPIQDMVLRSILQMLEEEETPPPSVDSDPKDEYW